MCQGTVVEAVGGQRYTDTTPTHSYGRERKWWCGSKGEDGKGEVGWTGRGEAGGEATGGGGVGRNRSRAHKFDQVELGRPSYTFGYIKLC